MNTSSLNRLSIKLHILFILLFISLCFLACAKAANAAIIYDMGEIGEDVSSIRVDFMDFKEDPFIKIKPTQTGYVRIDVWHPEANNYLTEDYEVVLYKKFNGKLKPASYRTCDAPSNFRYLYVKKGKTYYVRFRFTPPEYGKCGPNYFRVDMCNMYEHDGGIKKSKSRTINRGDGDGGYVTYDDGKTDWYKFSVSKKGSYDICLEGDYGKFHGNYVVSLYKKGSNKVIKKCKWNNHSHKFTKTLSKGTYYLKVYNTDRKNNGCYWVNWDKKGQLEFY